MIIIDNLLDHYDVFLANSALIELPARCTEPALNFLNSHTLTGEGKIIVFVVIKRKFLHLTFTSLLSKYITSGFIHRGHKQNRWRSPNQYTCALIDALIFEAHRLNFLNILEQLWRGKKHERFEETAREHRNNSSGNTKKNRQKMVSSLMKV